jgi:cell division septum initiation protein DivIVA
MSMKPSEIHALELPRRFRGYDETATKALLAQASKALEAAVKERDAAVAKLKTLESGGVPSAPPENEAETLGSALLTAKRIGEQLVEEARTEAARLTSEAEAKAHDVLGRAEAEAQSKVSDLTGRADALRRSESDLAAALDERQKVIRTYIRHVGEQLSELAKVAGSVERDVPTYVPRELDRTLQVRVESAVPPPDAA